MKMQPLQTIALWLQTTRKWRKIQLQLQEYAMFLGLLNAVMGGVTSAAEAAGDVIGAGVELVSENPGKALAVVGAVVVTGGGALLAAGPIAATAGGLGLLGTTSTGTAIASLSGAALTNASLAALGGGALAAGGGGVAAGTAVVATTGAVAGGAASIMAVS